MAALSQAEYLALDATGMAALVREGAVTATDMLDAALERLAVVNPLINAVIEVYQERAHQAADRPANEGPFRGVPFLIKDLFTELAGTCCANGSLFSTNVPATTSSIVVDRYERSGMLIVGRTHCPEFGGTSTSESRLHGVTRNPHDLRLSAGGSSGGAAAAVAAGIVPVAQATDAGGSIIIPASCCGLFGLKPTSGLVPLGPSRIEGAGGLAVQHVVSRSVRDSAALQDIACATVARKEALPFAKRDAQPLPRLRIARIETSVHGIIPSYDCAVALDQTAALLSDLGHSVENATLPFSADTYDAAERALRLASISGTILGLVRRVGREPCEADFEAATWQRYRAGLRITGVEILEAREAMLSSRLTMQAFMDRYDILLTPAMADPPPEPGAVSLDRIDPEAQRRNQRLTTFCALYNWTGQPAMSVPLHRTNEGMPIGVLLAGRGGDDHLLLRLASELEIARPWTGLAPIAMELV